MHPVIAAVLSETEYDFPAPNAITLQNAEKLLNYIEDINLERTSRLVPTPSQSLYILWSVEDWEFHMECLKTGSILYTFSKRGHEEARGSYPLDQFLPQLERYLLMGVG